MKSFIKNIVKKIFFFNDNSFKCEQKLLSVGISKNDIVIDCGANVGKITLLLAKTKAKVYAFEPNRFAFEVLAHKTSRYPNVVRIQKGVSHKKEKAKLYYHEKSNDDEILWSSGSSLLNFKSNILKEKYQEVELIDLSEFINNLARRVKVLKIDVEGVEVDILNRLIDTGVINKIDHVFVETHDHKIPELKQETDALRKRLDTEQIKHVDLNWF